MTPAGGPVTGEVEQLAERWQARSSQYVRCVSDIWWDPTCHHLIEALIGGGQSDIQAAIQALGRVRRAQRFDLLEAVDDLYALIEIVPAPSRRHLDSIDIVRALSQAWREDPAPSDPSPTTDALSRHPSFDYLLQRATELYEAKDHAAHGSNLSCVLFALVRPDTPPLDRLAARIRLGFVAHSLFAGYPRAMGDRGCAAVVSLDVAGAAAAELKLVVGIEVSSVEMPAHYEAFRDLLVRRGLVAEGLTS